MCEEQVGSRKRLNILYDDAERHYLMISNITVAMARRYVCKGCHKSCRSDVTHACNQMCQRLYFMPPVRIL